MNIFNRALAWAARVGWVKVAAGAAVLVVAGVGVHAYIRSTSAAPDAAQSAPQVSVASVAALSSQLSPLSLVGTVQSVSEATIEAQSSGPVTAVYHHLGDYVSAGGIIAELEDSSQRASVLQAQGGVDAAQAALAKISVGGQSAKTGAVNALLSAYSGMDSAIRGTADTFFSNPTTASPQFLVLSSNSQLVTDIQNERPQLAAPLSREKAQSGVINENSDLAAELSVELGEARTARTFLDNIIGALNSGIPTSAMPQATISGYLAAATAARASLNASLSSLAAAQAALTTAQSSGASASPDVAAGQAALTQAQGALAAARANLEKSIIRAPISGTLNSFSLKTGDFVSQNSPIATVANNGALEIVAYLSQQDTVAIAVGDKVSLEGGNAGVITRIAPALDPTTKKIEVDIAVSGQSSLLNGQSVLISLPQSAPAAPAKAGAPISIPITALKVGASETDVFTVASSTLVAHPVTIGELMGDRVAIQAGLTPDMIIVTDARGLRDGELVEVVSQ